MRSMFVIVLLKAPFQPSFFLSRRREREENGEEVEEEPKPEEEKKEEPQETEEEKAARLRGRTGPLRQVCCFLCLFPDWCVTIHIYSGGFATNRHFVCLWHSLR